MYRRESRSALSSNPILYTTNFSPPWHRCDCIIATVFSCIVHLKNHPLTQGHRAATIKFFPRQRCSAVNFSRQRLGFFRVASLLLGPDLGDVEFLGFGQEGMFRFTFATVPSNSVYSNSHEECLYASCIVFRAGKFGSPALQSFPF
jgi:hypothetical protein